MLTTRHVARFVNARRFGKLPIEYKPGSLLDMQPSGQNLFTVSYKHDEAPLVCVLGWLGAEWRHLNKFTTWYNSCNIPTLATIPRLPSTVSHSLGKRYATQYIDQIQSLHQDSNRPIIFHTLSGNGLLFLGRLIHDPNFHLIKHRIRGVVIDSAPPEIRADRFSRGFVGATKTLLGYKMSTAYANTDFYHNPFLTPIFEFLFNIFLIRMGKLKQFETIRQDVIKKQPHVPQLYLFSDADELVPPQDVTNFINMNKSARHDALIQELRFKDSKHVQHFKMYPKEYSTSILNFIEKCLSGNAQPTSSQPVVKKIK
ncbi:hypothetical protein AKO1_006910 [Acrasis kona]|uniref:Transmembrane protein 53 n=1 Tax=Acrasis kona TaxID=1008807 RepID=A0AAW2YTQ8_9EUKA